MGKLGELRSPMVPHVIDPWSYDPLWILSKRDENGPSDGPSNGRTGRPIRPTVFKNVAMKNRNEGKMIESRDIEGESSIKKSSSSS